MVKLTVIVVLSVALRAPSSAAVEAHTGSANSKPGSDDQIMVCRRESVAGSHFKKRICRSKGQIREERKAAMRMLRDSERRDSLPVSIPRQPPPT